jgi:AcrR family transcriptional regulator
MARADDVDARTDARWMRADAALRAAALALAAHTPLQDLSLAAVATAAGVSRSTAYEHASTPRELVEAALVTELDTLRSRHLAGIAPEETPAATAAVTRDVIAHIEAHAAVYRRGLAADAGAGALNGMLSRHFAASVRLLLDARDVDPGIAADDATTKSAVDELVVRGIADGTVGQIAAWIALPAPRDAELFLAVNRRLLPEWWIHAGEDR